MPNDDFFSQYLSYVGKTESPATFHRWCAISGIGALLGRNACLQHGHFTVAPNLYVMLLGRAGVRKSTAIKLFKRLLIGTGYNTIAADRTTKEKFLLDLSGEEEVSAGVYKKVDSDAMLDSNLWGDDDDEVASRAAAECFIMADEWNDFTSLGNLEFYSLLGNFWDYNGVFKNRIKTGKSVSINNPTISILAGNTPTGFAQAFPPEIIGQGFFSRLILVHGEDVGHKIAFPQRPSDLATMELTKELNAVRAAANKPATLKPEAERLLDKIYSTYKGFDDARFESYFNRRFTHLLKLCIITAAARFSHVICEQDVIYANTVLTHTEHGMPKALGEFGKGRNSDVANKIIDILSNSKMPMTMQKLWSLVSQDCDKQSSLTEILANLRAAEKIQSVGNGFMARRKVVTDVITDAVDYTLLTTEERGL